MRTSKHASVAAAIAPSPNTKVAVAGIRSPYEPGMSPVQQAALMAAPMVVGKAIDLGIAAVQKVRDAANKSRSYREMLEVNPHLHTEDAVQVQRYFNTMHRLNPDFASDPIVAGSFIANQLSMSTPHRPHAGMFEGAKQLAGINRGGGHGPSAGEGIQKYLMDLQGAASKNVVGDLQGKLQQTQGELKDVQGKLHTSRNARRGQVMSWVQQHKQQHGGQPPTP